jgi:hypothetical protein
LYEAYRRGTVCVFGGNISTIEQQKNIIILGA